MSERSTTLGKESSKSKSVAGNSHKKTTRKGKKNLSPEEVERRIRRAKIRDELMFMMYLKKKQQLKQKARA